ncbi:MAG: hypothetical protein KJ065_19215 [Anaerolineae bacterium]|nr:hypothetical protein [Anaerolineae bacterium]
MPAELARWRAPRPPQARPPGRDQGIDEPPLCSIHHTAQTIGMQRAFQGGGTATAWG